MAQAYFYHQAEFQLAICKEYGYAVWLNQVKSHLQGKHHRMSRKQAEFISSEVGSWQRLIRSPGELRVPAQMQRPITELLLFKDRLLCQKDPGSCQYICRGNKSMKEHWRIEHGWSVGRGRGRPGRRAEERLGERF